MGLRYALLKPGGEVSGIVPALARRRANELGIARVAR
jgi:hypothetical protein